ncbi:MAG: hypothetical protein AB7S48_07245 [Bacteroidales bacterium]
MGELKGFFDSFKEFIWDIIGYLIPGLYLILVLSICIKQEFYSSSDYIGFDIGLSTFFLITIGYVLGYVIYGFSWWKESILGKYSYRERIEKEFQDKTTYKICKDLIEKKIKRQDNNQSPIEKMSLRELRNIVMSYIPESDQKIYTFTFRSELSNHIGNISLIIGLVGILSRYMPFLRFFSIMETNKTVTLFYFSLLIAFFLLRYTRNRFYEISIKIPFSIFLAKENKL